MPLFWNAPHDSISVHAMLQIYALDVGFFSFKVMPLPHISRILHRVLRMSVHMSHVF